MTEEHQAGGHRAILNLRELEPGSRIVLSDGATAEVLENPRDGMWLRCRFLSSPDDPAREGTEDEVFAQDVAGILDD